MAQIRTKFIQDGAVTDAKIATGIDATKIADGSVSNTEFQYLDGVTSNIQSQLDDKVDESREGVANGIATLDAGGKVPASQLPNSIMEYLGTWAASSNTPALADGTGNAGDVYIASDAGTVNFGSGPITFAAGDWVIYNGSQWERSINSNAVASVNSLTGAVVLDTDDIGEGASNLYFTDERAQDAIGAALVDTSSVDLSYDDANNEISATVLPAGVDHNSLQNFVASEHVDHSSVDIETLSDSGLDGGGDITSSRSLTVAPHRATSETIETSDEILFADASDSNALKKSTVQGILDLVGPGVTSMKVDNIVLTPTNIANQYYDLSHVVKPNSIILTIYGLVQNENDDYTVALTGGVGGKTRINFENDLATGGASALVAGDVLFIQYLI
jgi:hypothetical protein